MKQHVLSSVVMTLLVAVIAAIVSGIYWQSPAIAGVFFFTAAAAGGLTLASFADGPK